MSKIKKQIQDTPEKERTNWPDAITLLDLERKGIDVDLCKLENCEDFNLRGVQQRYYEQELCTKCKKLNPKNSCKANIFNTTQNNR